MASTANVFCPFLGQTTAVSVSGSTARGALNLPAANTGLTGGMTVRIYNATSVTVFIKFGDSTVTAATTDTPIAPGAVEMFAADGATYVAGITASGTGTLYATPGMGA
jgi:hypothetical protein